MYKSSDADVRRNKFLGYFVAFSDFKNAVLVDNLVTYSEDHPNLCKLIKNLQNMK